MPRARPTQAPTTWSCLPHRLSAETKAELLERLNIDQNDSASDRIVFEIEKWLGFYAGADAAVRGLPSPAQYVAALRRVTRCNDARQLRAALQNLHPYVRSALESRIIDAGGDATQITLAQNCAKELIEQKHSLESRGRRKNEALRHVTKRLLRIFGQYWKGEPKERPEPTGCAVPRSEWEYDELEFVRIALEDAGIPTPVRLERLLNEASITESGRYRRPLVAIPIPIKAREGTGHQRHMTDRSRDRHMLHPTPPSMLLAEKLRKQRRRST